LGLAQAKTEKRSGKPSETDPNEAVDEIKKRPKGEE
jgi:hypothetical protein